MNRQSRPVSERSQALARRSHRRGWLGLAMIAFAALGSAGDVHGVGITGQDLFTIPRPRANDVSVNALHNTGGGQVVGGFSLFTAAQPTGISYVTAGSDIFS